MKIACETCGAKYTIADDKVRGRKVKIRCKSCGTPIVVDGQHGGGPSISDVEADAALEPAEAPMIWSVNLSDTDSRTMSVEEIIQGYASGLVTADAFVWKDGMADWVPVLESELAPLLGGSAEFAGEPDWEPAPVAASPVALASAASATATPRSALPVFTAPNQASAAPRPAATRPQSLPDNTQDLFGSSAVAGSEEGVASSAPIIPQAGASAYDDGKLTGARNENSVLFSLDALKAGFSPSGPAAKSSPKSPSPGGRPHQASNPDDPFGMGASGGLMGIGGGVLFGADNQALLTAPAAPLPPPPPTPAQVAAGVIAASATRPKNNKLLMIVSGVGVVIILLLLVLLLGRKNDTTPIAEGSASASAAPASAAPASVASASVAPASVAPQASAEATPEASATKAGEAPAASASAAASAAPSAPSAAKPAVDTSKPAAVVVAKVTSDTSVKKAKEDPIPAGASDLPPFSKSSAISALTAASMAASVCRKPGGPTGNGKATVTFAPSGRVTTATVSGAYAGTPEGGCVASGFRKAHVPAFSGSAVTVSKSFSIN
jgi:predicted Zn finger-like uncharacterized protein